MFMYQTYKHETKHMFEIYKTVLYWPKRRIGSETHLLNSTSFKSLRNLKFVGKDLVSYKK